MTTSNATPRQAHHLHRLIQQALADLRLAREISDAATAKLAERRMNALLDQLPADMSTGTSISA